MVSSPQEIRYLKQEVLTPYGVLNLAPADGSESFATSECPLDPQTWVTPLIMWQFSSKGLTLRLVPFTIYDKEAA